MTGSYSAILGGCLAAFLLGYGVGFTFRAIQTLINVATSE